MTEQRKRTTRLDQWQPLLATPGVSWINLQYGDMGKRPGLGPKRTGRHDPRLARRRSAGRRRFVFGGMAALDLVICVDNSTAHLGGAFGNRDLGTFAAGARLALGTGKRKITVVLHVCGWYGKPRPVPGSLYFCDWPPASRRAGGDMLRATRAVSGLQPVGPAPGQSFRPWRATSRRRCARPNAFRRWTVP